MSSRLLTGIGLALIGVAGAVFLAQMKSQAPGTASLLIRADNGGVMVAGSDARVHVFPTDNPEVPIATGPVGQPMSLIPGTYDVQVLLSRSRDVQARWLRGIELPAGARLSRGVEFSAGELAVEVAAGSAEAEPGQAMIYVFVPGNHDTIVTSMPSGAAVMLDAGRYDLRVVWTVGTEERDVRWVRNALVTTGLQTRLTVAFDRGSLTVTAHNAGAPIPVGAVTLAIYAAGDLQRAVVDTGLNGVPLGLASGSYDVRATFTGSNDKPERWIRGLDINDGEVSEPVVEFSSGGIQVNAEVTGSAALGPYDVYTYFYRAGDHQEAITYTPAGDNVVLEGGRYDVRASYFRSHDQPDIWLRGVTVESGETQVHTVAFPSGRLLVRAYDDEGDELIGDNVFVYVYAQGQRGRPVVVARSGELITLSEGGYDIRGEDTRRPGEERWLEGIRLEAGRISEHALAF